MARKEAVVSRTVTFTKGVFLTVSKDGQTSEKEMTLGRTYKDNESLLKAAKRYAEENGLETPVYVKSSEVIEKRLAQYESDFINSDKTFELPALKIKNATN